MKTLLSIFAITFVFGFANAQELKQSQIPASVVSAFQKMYPTVKDVEWGMENGSYEAEFNVGKLENAALYDAKGNLVQTEKGIEIKDLPGGVAAYVSKNYPGASIKEAAEVTDAKGMKTYVAEVKGVDLIFDAKGNYMKSEKD